MTRKVYWVSPDGENWKVKAEGAERSTKIFDRKQDAIDFARQLAKNQQPSQIKIQNQKGIIQEERTYGKDPFPPKG